MSTIDQIRDNAARATDMIKQLGSPAADSDASDAPAADAPEAAPAAPASTAPVAAAAPAAPADVTTANADENSESFAQRWRSLQGIHASTRDRLRESEVARQNLEQLVAQMQQASRAPAPAPKSHLTEKDQGEYGGEMVDFVRRAARDEMAPLAQAVRGFAAQLAELRKLAPAVEAVAAAQVGSTRESFHGDLTRQVPNWQTVNSDPAFHAWLLETDSYSGLQRDTLLKDAYDRLDLGRVVNIFRGFAQASGAPAASPEAPRAAAAAASPATSAQARLERQVAPGRVAGTAPPAAKVGKQWTGEQITKFYADKRNGVYRGKDEEAAAIERDIFDAQREGRIVLR